MVSLVIYGGILYMTAKGDPEKVKTAWGVIRNAVVGLAIVLASYTITVFILNALLRAAGFGEGSLTDNTSYIEPLSSALGAGIIQDHYPPRLGVDIPRNTKIIITFKQPIEYESLLETGTFDASAELVTGQLNTDNVKIYQTGSPTAFLASSAVNVSVTSDRRTFVFDPVALLGDPIDPINYSVFLSPNIRRLLPDLITTAPAFTGDDVDGYLWVFTTSTLVDITPPHVVSFIPNAGGTYARNIVVQITFNEAIDPTSSTGIYHPSASSTQQFSNLQMQNVTTSGRVEGTWQISNAYRTVEFVTFDQCGTNACGGDIFCLPASSSLRLLARSATLGAEPPEALFTSTGYNGVTDVSGNSLDGGGEEGLLYDGQADGPPTPIDAFDIDNFWVGFSTSAVQNTNRPEITNLLPNRNQPDVDIAQDVEITFSELMRFSTLTNQAIGLAPRPLHSIWYVVSGENTQTILQQSKAVIDHGLFRDYDVGQPPQNYYPVIGNEVETAYQICFFPAYGPPGICAFNGGDLSSTLPSCCNGVPSNLATCPLPTP